MQPDAFAQHARRDAVVHDEVDTMQHPTAAIAQGIGCCEVKYAVAPADVKIIAGPKYGRM
jgi:hypothetical protein